MSESKNKKIIPTSSDVRKVTKEEISSSGEGRFGELSITSLHVKVGQLEEGLSSLKERVEGEQKLKLWIVGTIIAIGGGIIGGFVIYHNLAKDYQDSYRNLQKDYYQELINLNKEVLNIKQELLKNNIHAK